MKHRFINKAIKGQKRNKFGAIKCSHDGYKFDSIKEGNEYLNLRLRLEGGDISGLEIHPKYPIFIKNKLVCNVILDFAYWDCLTHSMCYIDVKGYDKKTGKFRVTPESKLKRKLLEVYKDITVQYI